MQNMQNMQSTKTVKFNTSLYFSTQSFMRTTSIIRRQKASEYKMAKRRYRQLIHPGTFTFQHLREGTWQYGDNGFQPPALSLGKPSMVF